MSIFDVLISVILPHRCVLCHEEGQLLCSKCADRLTPPGVSPQLAGLLSLRAATTYQGAAKDILWKLKSSGAQAAVKTMATLMVPLIQDDKALIVPVPTATGRVRQRGYDQARLLARQLARQAGLPYADCLARTGQTHQVGAGRQQRLKQLAGSFRVRRRSWVRGAHIILVDDVCTTGATLQAAAGVLRACGASRVEAVVFAQA